MAFRLAFRLAFRAASTSVVVMLAVTVAARSPPWSWWSTSPPIPREYICLPKLTLLHPRNHDGCYEPLTSGPCAPGEWLVVGDDGDRLVGLKCRQRPCRSPELLWPADGRCYDPASAAPCQPSEELVADPSGVGVCVCREAHARLAGSPSTSACYPLYRRGPCDLLGQTFAPKTGSAGRGAADPEGVCELDPCENQDADDDPFVLWPESEGGDGRCHKLGSSEEDLCVAKPSTSFGIHPDTLRPGCVHRDDDDDGPSPPASPCSNRHCRRVINVRVNDLLQRPPRTSYKYRREAQRQP